MGTDFVCLRVKISYKAGQTNGNADGLSRLPLPEMPESVPVPGETILLMEHLEGTPVHSGHIKEWTKRDPILAQVLRFILEGCSTKNNSEELNPYFTKRSELSVEVGCVHCGTRVVVPPTNHLWRQRGRVVRAPDLKSVGSGFKSRSDH